MAAPASPRFRFYAILSLMALTSLILISQIISFPVTSLPWGLQHPSSSSEQQDNHDDAAAAPPAAPSPSPSQPPPPSFRNYTSAHSFDADAADNPDWMARLPDSASVAHLSIPGTHDTLTHRLDDRGYQCQNHPLAAQLRAGVRYLDLRLRLNRAGELLVYHAAAYTGYTYVDVLLTAFAFLDEHPREGLVLRVKEEGPPVDNDHPGEFSPVVQPQKPGPAGKVHSNRTFEEAFNHYRLEDPRTAPGCAKHLFLSAADNADEMPIPSLGELRGKAMVLQEFKSPANGGRPYGIPWLSEQLRVEDYWIIANASYLDDKWDAIRENLELAANSTGSGDSELQRPQRLYISHLSASVGVLPIEAAAGPLDYPSIAGMNDRTGEWLAAEENRSVTGIVIADFPGRTLVDAILSHNDWLLSGQQKRRWRTRGTAPLGFRL